MRHVVVYMFDTIAMCTCILHAQHTIEGNAEEELSDEAVHVSASVRALEH